MEIMQIFILCLLSGMFIYFEIKNYKFNERCKKSEIDIFMFKTYIHDIKNEIKIKK